MSADYLALSGAVRPLQDQIVQLKDEHHATQVRMNTELEVARNAWAEERQAMEGWNQTLESERSALQQVHTKVLQQRNELQQQVSQSLRDITRLQHELGCMRRDFNSLSSHLHSIENSTVFRATRPIVHAKMRLDRILGRAPRAVEPVRHIPVPVTPPAHPVDVIVPVYRGLADTRLCVESVLASSCRTPYRLVVINDCSPEPEVTAWLRERAAGDDRILLLENEENLGFVGTVNRGMALSGNNDVLLLNSDTEVANDWLDRIRQAAYGDAKGRLRHAVLQQRDDLQLPALLQGQRPSPGYDTARLDALCARTNPGAVVDVPTGVGFCMYIRRDCLQQVGLFDTEHFGKGYGEENDFCQRAQAAGWRNLHLLDTFVLHTGGVSFGDSKSPRELAAMEILRRLHPNYDRDVHAFVRTDPAAPYRLALDAARITEAGQPLVLAVLHDRAGGTVRHVRELASHLGEQAQFLTLTPAHGHSVKLRMAGEEEGFELAFRLNDQYDALIDVLRRLGVSHVHFHHLLGHGQEVRNLPHLLDVTYDFTAHDYYSYCTHISMTGTGHRYAGGDRAGPVPVLPRRHASADRWHGGPMAPGQCPPAGWRTLRARPEPGYGPPHRGVRAPCAGTRRAAHRHAGSLRAAGASAPPAAGRPQAEGGGHRRAQRHQGCGPSGGRRHRSRAPQCARGFASHRLRLSQPADPAPRAPHRARRIRRKDLPQLLEWLQPDIVWFPAQWPETYSYTLSAALLAGLPVAVPDIGAFQERVVGRPWSWVRPWDATAPQWLAWFDEIRSMHFATGEAPALPQPVPLPDGMEGQAAPAGFRYDTDYLSGVTPVVPSQPLSLEELQRLQPQETTTAAAKSGLLSAVVYLRSLPVLRGVARRIPVHWQRRVKNWLQA